MITRGVTVVSIVADSYNCMLPPILLVVWPTLPLPKGSWNTPSFLQTIYYGALDSCIIRPHHSTKYVDAASVTDRVAWSVGMSVCWSVTLVSPAKTTEPIEMPFGLKILVGPGNHLLDGSSYPPCDGVIFFGKGVSHCLQLQGFSTVICAKTVAPIEMPFGLWAHIGPRNHALIGVHKSKGTLLWQPILGLKLL